MEPLTRDDLQAMESRLASSLKKSGWRTRTNFMRLEAKLERMDKLLRGSNKSPGLRAQVDHLMLTESRRRWTLRAAIVAGLASLGNWLWGRT